MSSESSVCSLCMFPELDLPWETALALLGSSWARAMETGTGISGGWWWKHPTASWWKYLSMQPGTLSHCVIWHRRPQALPGNASFASLSLWGGCSTLPEPSRPSQLPNWYKCSFLCFISQTAETLDENRSVLEDSCEFVRSRDLGKADQEKKRAQL